MPNRLIKESIHSSDKVNAMTDFQFRLWVNLITYVDDYGRGDARPAIIKGSCFPLRERVTNKDIDSALAGLAGIGCVSLYEVDGRPYLYFPNWEQHQSVRNKRSKYPDPDNLQAIEINCNQLQANVPVIQSNPNPNPNPNPKSAAAPTTPNNDDLSEFSEKLKTAIIEWIDYHKEIKKAYGEIGRRNLIGEIRNNARKYGEDAVIEAISYSIGRRYQGIVFDRLKDKKPKEIVQPKSNAADLARLKRLTEDM